MPREKLTQRRKGSEYERPVTSARRRSGDISHYRAGFRCDERLGLGRRAATTFLIGFHSADVPATRLSEMLSRSSSLVSHAPNLCAFASLREILYHLVAVQSHSDSVAKGSLMALNL
jgi:hypothetical protein